VRCVEIAICARAGRLDNFPERRFKADLDQSYEPLVWPHAGAAYSGRLIADVWDRSRLHTKALSATSSL
jgi:predicted class III extradiol MEMO1 family dioxygenase